jgi:hypothetical protein
VKRRCRALTGVTTHSSVFWRGRQPRREFAGASGVVTQRSLGHNTTMLIAGMREPAPNFRFEFELR